MHPGRHPRSESCDSKELSSSGSGSGSGCGPPSFATFARLVEGANATSRASRAEATSGRRGKAHPDARTQQGILPRGVEEGLVGEVGLVVADLNWLHARDSRRLVGLCHHLHRERVQGRVPG